MQRVPDSGILRERYEQIRERALEQTANAIGSDVLTRCGMRAWMEADWREQVGPVAPAFPAARPRPDVNFQQIVTVWASVLMGQAERS